MKVCFLIFNLEPGGLQNYLFRFLSYYKNQLNATIIVKNGEGGHFFNSFVSIGANVQPIKGGYFNLKGWFTIFNFLKVNRFDSLCDLTGNFGGVYLLLAKWCRIDKRVAYYGQSQDHFRKTIVKSIYNFLVNKLVYIYATCIVSNSSSGMNYYFPLRRRNDSRFKLIANGIDPNEFSCNHDNSIRLALNIPAKAFVIGNTSRYDEKKNHNAILQLAQLSCKKNDNFYYIICGYGTESLLPIIRELNLTERVFILGYRDDVPMLLRNFDAFYFPSFTEGLSNSLLEALLSGLPVVASNIESNREAMPQNLWSMLTEPDDYGGTYKKLLEINGGFYPIKPFDLRAWAISNFQHAVLFRKFLECI